MRNSVIAALEGVVRRWNFQSTLLKELFAFRLDDRPIGNQFLVTANLRMLIPPGWQVYPKPQQHARGSTGHQFWWSYPNGVRHFYPWSIVGNKGLFFGVGDLALIKFPLATTSVLFFASGFAALLYQIAWQRMLFGWYGVDLDSVSAIVSIFMLGLGLGALVGGWLADQFQRRRIFVFSLIELTIATFGIFSLGIIDGVGAFFSTGSLPSIVILTFLVFAIPTCAMGATLPVLVTELVDRTRSVGFSTGALYFVNTLGAAAGAFSAGFILLPRVGLDGLITAAAALNVSVSALAYVAFRGSK